MFAVIDSGTTTTRIYFVDSDKNIKASGRKKVGVRDTSITGSRKVLRDGIAELFFEIIKDNDIDEKDVEFAIASGMITSEIGLIEIPHLVAPVGIKELSESVLKVEDESVLPIGRPVYFIRGIRNCYPLPLSLNDLSLADFMRGEETQCIGIMAERELSYPCNFVALSSHTKIMFLNEDKEIAASKTTMSGQFYEALISSTNIGKSLVASNSDIEGENDFEQIVNAAFAMVRQEGLNRACMTPRFMQVLMKSSLKERKTFIDAAIAADDLGVFLNMREQGYLSNSYLFYGQKERCLIYKYMIEKELGDTVKVEMIYDQECIDRLTIDGAVAIAMNFVKTE